MPRRKKLEASTTPELPISPAPAAIGTLFNDIPAMSPHEVLRSATERMDRISASVRGDYAGTSSNLLSYPSTYQQRVLKVWEAYNTDSFFKRMIDRTAEFAANGFRWELKTENRGKSWIEQLKEWVGIAAKTDREEDFWAEWSSQINTGVPGVIPGLDEVTRWAARHLMLSGMFVPHWKLGTMKFGKREFIVPTQLTCYPGSAMTLLRQNASFTDERAYFKLPQGKSPVPLQEGMSIEAHPSSVAGADMQELPRMSDSNRENATEGFVLKYNWSPGDLVTLRRGQNTSTGAAIYPAVPFFGLIPQFLIRQKLFAADISVLDGIINYIIQYKIGDKDHPPEPPEYDPRTGAVVREGTIAMVRRLIREGRVGPAVELFLPYYVNTEIISMKPETLINEVKYVQSTLEIYAAFGIFFARSASGSRERMERINISNFEEFMNTLRGYIGAFLQILARHIVQLNSGQLSQTPRWSPNPLNTKNDKFIDQLMGLAKIGHVSKQSLLRYHGLDPDVEFGRIATELATDVDDMMNENVPTSYVQQTVQPDSGGKNPQQPNAPKGGPSARPGKTKTTAIPPTKQPGRPRKPAPTPPDDDV